MNPLKFSRSKFKNKSVKLNANGIKLNLSYSKNPKQRNNSSKKINNFFHNLESKSPNNSIIKSSFLFN